MSTLVRSLVKIGWAVLHDGSDLDMPLGTAIKLAQGIVGANGAAELPDTTDPAVIEARQLLTR
jgi:hypothetical protein